MPDASPVLDVRGLTVSLSRRRGVLPIVTGVDFRVGRSEILGIAGESGSGKSMTMLALLGLQPRYVVRGGSATFHGRDLLALGQRELGRVRGNEIGIVFQDPSASLHPMLTIERQLTEHVRRHLSVSRTEAHERAAALLTTVRIPDPERALRAYPHQFSGGMRQRIAIAMALACEPSLLIADEPTTALDVTVQAGILRLLSELARERSLSVILVTHDLGVLAAVADDVCVMYAGRIVETGSAREVLHHPRHPYTRALLDSLPEQEHPAGAAAGIPGSPPVPGRVPSGCAFHPRCTYARAECAGDVPEIEAIEGGHRVACPVDPLAPKRLEEVPAS